MMDGIVYDQCGGIRTATATSRICGATQTNGTLTSTGSTTGGTTTIVLPQFETLLVLSFLWSGSFILNATRPATNHFAYFI